MLTLNSLYLLLLCQSNGTSHRRGGDSSPMSIVDTFLSWWLRYLHDIFRMWDLLWRSHIAYMNVAVVLSHCQYHHVTEDEQAWNFLT